VQYTRNAIHLNQMLQVLLAAEALQSQLEFPILVYAGHAGGLAATAMFEAAPQTDHCRVDQIAEVIYGEFAPRIHVILKGLLCFVTALVAPMPSDRVTGLRVLQTVKGLEHGLALDEPLVS